MLNVQPVASASHWNHLLARFSTAHILQTWEWGDFKHKTTGWEPVRLAFHRGERVAAMVSIGVRRFGPFRLMYAPKGFTCEPDDQPTIEAVLDWLEGYARRHPTIWLKIDPDVVIGTGIPGDDDSPTPNGSMWQQTLEGRGWHFSADQVQFRNTICLDLRLDEDALLAAMSQNTRRKVRTAEKKGVRVRPAAQDDLATLYALYQTTGERDQFLIRPFAYYERAWRDFMSAGLAHGFIAEYQGQPIAHVILFHFGRKCWYFYGASSSIARETMPNYALQWEAIRWAKAQGYQTYDLWGAPDHFAESDPLWGVYEFKRGFRGVVTRHLGAWDYAPHAALYWAYTRAIPAARAFLRRS